MIDLELIGSEKSGIELIKLHKIQKQSILVTSHFMDHQIQKTCIENEVKMVPKESVVNLNIKILPHLNSTKIVLIDDDMFTHLNWKRAAKSKNVELTSFYSVKEFLSSSDNFELETSIYIDSNLGDNLKGEILSKEIYDLGFKNIFLATGMSEAEIEVPYWIKGVQGKRFCSL